MMETLFPSLQVIDSNRQGNPNGHPVSEYAQREYEAARDKLQAHLGDIVHSAVVFRTQLDAKSRTLQSFWPDAQVRVTFPCEDRMGWNSRPSDGEHETTLVMFPGLSIDGAENSRKVIFKAAICVI